MVVLTNQQRGSFGPAIAAGLVQLMLKAKLGSVPADPPPPVQRAGAGVSPERLAGTYKTASGIVRFAPAGDSLMRIEDRDTLRLSPAGERTFAAPGTRFQFDVISGRVHGVTVLARSYGANGAEYWPVNDTPHDGPGPARKEWNAYVGEYEGRSYGAAATTRLELRNGWLYTTSGGGQRLTPAGPGLFFTPDGESVELEPGAVVIGARRYVRPVSSPRR